MLVLSLFRNYFRSPYLILINFNAYWLSTNQMLCASFLYYDDDEDDNDVDDDAIDDDDDDD